MALPAETSDFLEGLMEGFVAYDRDWRISYINAAGERLLGRERGKVLGLRWLEAFPHARDNPVDRMYQRVMRERIPERLEMYYEHYGRWLEISASPVSSGGIAVYFRDTTDRNLAEQALREADRRKDEFLATLAHELRNPLAPLRNGLYLLRMADRDTKTAEQAREMMERQMTHLVRLVDDLLDISRISRGKIELRTEAVEVAAAVGSAVETSSPLIEAAGHSLQIDLPAEVITVRADPVRIAQVIANLLNNAAKYTPSGGRIALAVRAREGQCEISVQDNGLGIEPDMLPRVFDMFAQGDRTMDRSQGGLGIGLTLAKRLVELHGGAIEARSAGHGRGSEFMIRLPVLSSRQL